MRSYEVYGPFPVDHNDECTLFWVDKTKVPSFTDVAESYGCYIYARRWGEGWKPWYVGKTRVSFRQEIFQAHKQQVLARLRELVVRGAIFVFLIAPSSNQGRKSLRAVIDMETFLIGTCFRVNKALLNVRKLPSFDWEIRGVTDGNRGKPSPAAQAVRSFI